jgi:hypothetical protein
MPTSESMNSTTLDGTSLSPNSDSSMRAVLLILKVCEVGFFLDALIYFKIKAILNIDFAAIL